MTRRFVRGEEVMTPPDKGDRAGHIAVVEGYSGAEVMVWLSYSSYLPRRERWRYYKPKELRLVKEIEDAKANTA